ncbi:hypothetical protein PGT21_005137 [Puccinia graminis f. sp. tritici]|uniref:Uncharacterized protein n=1 Tax=Puccinia graminis f. sp. tritici TaxID=56615 RepID=A0A5B0MMY3_PUCGR|nr:hypothetical protein PGT21_005137 [Puccinia graminis f. sp. tritici]
MANTQDNKLCSDSIVHSLVIDSRESGLPQGISPWTHLHLEGRPCGYKDMPCHDFKPEVVDIGPLNPTSDHYVRSDPSRQGHQCNLHTPLVPVADPLRSLFLVRRCPEIANSNYTLRTPKTPIDCSALAI